MTDKQEKFCEEYVIDRDPVRAYMAVYKSCKKKEAASACASRLLKDANVSARVRELSEAVTEKALITGADVVRDLIAVKDRCMQARPVQVWDEEQHAYVDSEAMFQFDSKGANQALKMLGDYCGIFEKKIKISGLEEEQSKLGELLAQRRERR